MKNETVGAQPQSEEAPGLYVHVPFCASKCPYCDFYSVAPGAAVRSWLAALGKEMRLHRGMFAPFDTLYVGGGTPSLLGENDITSLLEELRETFDFAADTETTIEANPDDVNASRLAAYRGVGINRLSLGVQSFDDAELRFLRRRHDAAGAERAVTLARSAEFASIGIDLIYGFHGQSIASWKRTLTKALDFAPEHISCYQMTIEHSTEFGRMLDEKKISFPSEEAQRTFFMTTAGLVSARGYVHYEISNFAREEERISRHNRKYWRHVPYLGLGPSSHSFRDGTRWWNVRSVSGYCEALEKGKSPVEGRESLTPDDLALETLYLGFRTRDGVALDDLRKYRRWNVALDELRRESLVKIEGGRAVPTLKGFLVADRLPILFAE